MAAKSRPSVCWLLALFAPLLVVSCQEISVPWSSAQIEVSIDEPPALPIARAGHVGGMVDGRVFVAGGSNWSDDRSTKNWLGDSYVFAEGKWQKGPMLPEPTSDAFYAYDANGLYIAGGTDGKNQTAKSYRLSTTSPEAAWESLAPLPRVMSDGSGAIIGGAFYVACGYVGKTLSSELWALDITEPHAKWRPRSSLPGPPRAYPALVACGGHLYLLGGLVLSNEHPTMKVLQDTYRYDPATDQWQRLDDLSFGGYAWSAAAVDERHILLTARASENANVSNGIWMVNIDDMTKTKIAQTVIPTCCAPLVQVDRATWWLLGGEPAAARVRTPRVTAITLTRGAP